MQICALNISGVHIKQMVKRRSDILVYLLLSSVFLLKSLFLVGFGSVLQMSLSMPLPKGRGRGIQIHGPHSIYLGLYVQQPAYLIPWNEIDGGWFFIAVAIPIVNRSKCSSVHGYADDRTNRGAILFSIELQRLINLLMAKAACC